MPYFDIVWGFIPDYVHAVLLGVIRQFTELLLNNSDQPYYIGNASSMRLLENRRKEHKATTPDNSTNQTSCRARAVESLRVANMASVLQLACP